MDAGNVISLITGVLGIAGTVGGVVGWLVERSITKAITPLTYEMKALNTHLEANNVEHKTFRDLLEDHEDCLHDHDKRIAILENIGGK